MDDHRFHRAFALAFAWLSLSAAAAFALTINAAFDPSLTSQPNAHTMEGAINRAAGLIGNLYSDPGTVNILFQYGPGDFLGESNSSYYTRPYATYVGLLQADATAHPDNTALATAITNLPLGNDGNGSRSIIATSPLLRVALGDASATPCYNAAGNFVNGCNQIYDGVITLSSSYTQYFTRPIPAADGITDTYDGLRTVEHEIGEVLGGGGSGTTLGGSDRGRYYGTLDPYRYSAPGTPGFATARNAMSYLSIDGGVTNIVPFNQDPNGDFADFDSSACPGLVQDAFACANAVADVSVTSPEYTMMEALGYDPANNFTKLVWDCVNNPNSTYQSGSFSATKITGCTQIITGPNTFTGGTTIAAGTLQLGNGDAIGSLTGDVVDNGRLAFDRSDTVVFAGAISGTGQVRQIGTGTTILSGQNSYSGGTFLLDGTLKATSSAALGTGAVSFIGLGATLVLANGVNFSNAVNVNKGGFINVNGTDTATLSGVLSGTADLEKDGTGMLVFTGDNRAGYSGDIAFRGTIVAGVTGALGTGAITSLGSPTLVLRDGVVLSNTVFLSGDLTLEQDGGLAVLNGAIQRGGPARALIKAGAGTVVLTGIGNAAGQVVVNGGTLQVDGSLANASGVVVNAGAALQGNGTLPGLMVNGGGVLIAGTGSVPGSLTVQGNAVLAAGATLQVNWSPAATSQVSVSGAVAAGGSVVLSPVQGYQPRYGDSAVILTAASITGGFDAVPDTIPGVLFPKVSIVTASSGQQAAVLSIAAAPLANFLVNPTADQLSLANALDALRAGSYGALAPIYAALDPLGDAAALGRALAGLVPNVQRAQSLVTQTQTTVLTNMLWQHLAAIQADDEAAEGFRVELQPLRLAMATQPGTVSDMGRQFLALGQQAATGSDDGGAVMSLPKGMSGYLTGTALSGSVAVGGSGARADMRGFVVTGGLDLRVAPGLTVGGALAVSQSSTVTRLVLDTSQADRIQGAVYGRYDFGERWIGEALVSWGRESFSMRRTVPVGAASFALASHADGDATAFGAYLGKALDVGDDDLALTLIPSLGLQYLGMGIDPFAETGGVAAMTFSRFSAGRTQGRLGLDGSMTVHMLDMAISPAAHVAWVDEFGGDDGVINAAFAAALGTSMSFAPLPHDRAYAELGFGADMDLGAMMGSPTTLGARYDASAGRRDLAYQTWTGRLTVHL